MTIELVGIEERGPGKIVVPRAGDVVEFRTRTMELRETPARFVKVRGVMGEEDLRGGTFVFCEGVDGDQWSWFPVSSIISINGVPVDNRDAYKEATDASHE